MALKAVLKSLDNLPDEIKTHYKKLDDGTYVLDTDTGDYDKRLSEFRSNNKTLNEAVQKARADLEKFKDVDIDLYNAAREQIAKLEEIEESELLKKGKVGFDQVLTKRTEALKRQYEEGQRKIIAERDEYKNKNSELQSRINEMVLDQQTDLVFNEIARPRKSALDDIRARVRRAAKVDEEGNISFPNVKNAKGEEATFRDFAEALVKEADHLFESAGGGGSGGGARSRAKEDPKLRTLVHDGSSPIVLGANDLDDVASGKAVIKTRD